jgi:hypothetical protein
MCQTHYLKVSTLFQAGPAINELINSNTRCLSGVTVLQNFFTASRHPYTTDYSRLAKLCKSDLSIELSFLLLLLLLLPWRKQLTFTNIMHSLHLVPHAVAKLHAR